MIRGWLAFAVAAGAILLCVPAAVAYPWPLKPFDRAHPIYENFGDPTTIFHSSPGFEALNGPGQFSFRNGVDMAARARTPVYPVASGRVTLAERSKVVVQTAGGEEFQYVHVRPAVAPGVAVEEGTSVLGFIDSSATTLHFADLVNGRAVNPLALGRLSPYRDRAAPHVRAVDFREPTGRSLNPLTIRGHVDIVADAYDLPAVPATNRWRAFAVAPALVTWRLQTLAGAPVVPETIAVDLLDVLPRNEEFWRIYARGTYQNMPVLGSKRFASMPGRYLFLLTERPINTDQLARGIYVVTVTAYDARGNHSSLSERFALARFSR
jgi:murein DD-endopeptidase MepM/ murein hydrolase activator NlpD